MNENEKKEVEMADNTEVSDLDLATEFKKYKENSVPREEYDKLRTEHKKLLRDFINGPSGDSTEVKDAGPSIQDLRDTIFGDNVEQMSNRDFWANVSELYHKRLEEDGVNIFLPKGKKTRYERRDYEVVSSMMETIDSMLEDTVENPDLFTTMFNNALS